MTSSGPFQEHRSRTAGSIAPRRHSETQRTRAADSYDSTEFPVLLRMTDVSQSKPAGAPIPETSIAEPESMTDSSSKSHTRSAYRSRRERASSGDGRMWEARETQSRMTGSAARRFWSTIPPKVAAGGMLLAIITLCFFFLRGPAPAVPSPGTDSQWSADESAKNDHHYVDTPAESDDTTTVNRTGPATHSSVAAKPAPPQSLSPTPVQRVWPNETGDSAGGPSWEGTKVKGVAPDLGWPAETDNSREESEIPLTPPIAPTAAGPEPTPGVRTSQLSNREAEGAADASNAPDGPSRLTGSMEIPPPVKLYRQ